MTQVIHRCLRYGLLAGTLSLLAGCGHKELSKPETYPAHGRVLWKGEPVRFALITLEPVGPVGAPADGRTEEDGTFTLRTLSNDEPDGAVPGEYRVKLESYNPVKAGALPQGGEPTVLPPGFNPDITVEIKAEDNDLTIDIP